MKWRLPAMIALALVATRCRTTQSAPNVLEPHECSCGEADTDILGCPAGCCLSSIESCENELCTCSALQRIEVGGIGAAPTRDNEGETKCLFRSG